MNNGNEKPSELSPEELRNAVGGISPQAFAALLKQLEISGASLSAIDPFRGREKQAVREAGNSISGSAQAANAMGVILKDIPAHKR